MAQMLGLQAKNSTGIRWDLNPGPCRYHSHCCKCAKALLYLTPKTDIHNTYIYFEYIDPYSVIRVPVSLLSVYKSQEAVVSPQDHSELPLRYPKKVKQ